MLLLVFGMRTYQRNKDWQNEELLFSSSLKKANNNAKLLYNMGLISQRKHHIKEAEEFYIKALSIYPECVDCYTNLGEIYASEYHNLDKAIH